MPVSAIVPMRANAARRGVGNGKDISVLDGEGRGRSCTIRAGPEFAKKMLKCFYDYRFPPEMQKAFDGADRFVPVTFRKDWEVVRKVAEGSGEAFNRANYDKQTAKEAEAAKKKAEDAAKGKK